MKNINETFGELLAIFRPHFVKFGLMTIVVLLCLIANQQSVKASGTYYGGARSIIGTGSGSYNNILVGVTNTNSISSNGWPALLTNTSTTTAAWMTNITPFSITGLSHVCVAVTCSSTTVTGGGTVSNAVWMIGRLLNFNGSSPTNLTGTNASGQQAMPYEVLGYITNVLNGTNQVTSFATYSEVPRTTSANNQSTDPGIAGCDTLCIIALQNPGNTSLTNYQAYCSGY